MSAVSNILAAGLNVIGVAADRSVEYRATAADDWAAVDGAIASVNTSEPVYDETGNVHQVVRVGVAHVPIGGTDLANGGQVRIDGSDAQVFTVRGRPVGVGINTYTIVSADAVRFGPDRGRSRQ